MLVDVTPCDTLTTRNTQFSSSSFSFKFCFCRACKECVRRLLIYQGDTNSKLRYDFEGFFKIDFFLFRCIPLVIIILKYFLSKVHYSMHIFLLLSCLFRMRLLWSARESKRKSLKNLLKLSILNNFNIDSLL